jgi:hypothetical protein
MLGYRPFASLIALAAFAAPSAARAEPAAVTSRVISPLSILKIADLDFGGVAVAGAGTVVIDPNSNAISYTGGVIAAGETPSRAEFMGAAQKRTVVNIRIPRRAITITRVGGTETLSVSNWTLEGQDKRELAARSSFTFGVGATLTVPANAVEGTYEGSFDVEIQYP